MDVHTPQQRSFNMSRIRGKDTKPEILLRKKLWHAGFRYHLHKKDLPGKPDIVLSKYKAVIFVHGCFWHQHQECSYARRPKSRKEFWNQKLDENIERDRRNIDQLKALGWRVAIVWECAIKKRLVFEQTMTSLEDWIRSDRKELEISTHVVS